MEGKKKKKRQIFLKCSKCSQQNYRTSKTSKLIVQGSKLELSKYCKFCQKTQVHNEKLIK